MLRLFECYTDVALTRYPYIYKRTAPFVCVCVCLYVCVCQSEHVCRSTLAETSRGKGLSAARWQKPAADRHVHTGDNEEVISRGNPFKRMWFLLGQLVQCFKCTLSDKILALERFFLVNFLVSFFLLRLQLQFLKNELPKILERCFVWQFAADPVDPADFRRPGIQPFFPVEHREQAMEASRICCSICLELLSSLLPRERREGRLEES